MLFKSFALCAAFAAIAPAFAAPVAEAPQPNLARRQLIDVGAGKHLILFKCSGIE